MAVNLSAQQLKQSHFVEDVRHILLKVIAGGTAGQADYLHANACDYVQGYLFSRSLAGNAAARVSRQAVLLPVAAAE